MQLNGRKLSNQIMIYLSFHAKTYQKVYLQGLEEPYYDSLLSLIYAIFSTYVFEDKAVELYLYQLLDATGYRRIEDIPRIELELIVAHFLKHKKAFKIDYDSEYLTYLLLAAIKRLDILVYFDEHLIEDLEAPIQLEPDSVLSFIKKEKIERTTFKTI